MFDPVSCLLLVKNEMPLQQSLTLIFACVRCEQVRRRLTLLTGLPTRKNESAVALEKESGSRGRRAQQSGIHNLLDLLVHLLAQQHTLNCIRHALSEGHWGQGWETKQEESAKVLFSLLTGNC